MIFRHFLSKYEEWNDEQYQNVSYFDFMPDAVPYIRYALRTAQCICS